MLEGVPQPSIDHFRELVEYAPDAFVLVDPQRVITYVNRFAEQVYDWPREELIGQSIEVLVPERFRALLAGMDTASIKPGGALGAGLPLWGRRRDGSEFPCEIRMMPIKTEKGLEVASIVRDVTRRREMEEALAASEAKYRRVVEGLKGDYFFATIAPDGSVSYASPSIESMLGYGPDAFGKHMREFLTDHPMNDAAEEMLRRELAGEAPPPYDLELRHADGSTRIVECSDTPILDDAGTTIAIESINRDVTTLRAHEKALRQAHARTDALLRRILPDSIADELSATDRAQPRRHRDVAILFCDLVGFTAWCDTRDPEEVVDGLSELVERYERVAVAHGLQKIKTIGDAFMGAAGLLRDDPDPVHSALDCGRALIEASRAAEPAWELRVGIHVGDVVAGVMGRRQFGYDLWGDAVNTAARMEGLARPGHIALSVAAWRCVRDRVEAEPLGRRAVKGKGEMEVYLVAV